MIVQLLLLGALVLLNSVLVLIAAKALFMPVKQKRKQYKRLCADHSASRKKRGVWILDSENCDLCDKGPKGAA